MKLDGAVRRTLLSVPYTILALTLGVLPFPCSAASPHLLDDQFELPSGFHIYRVAGPELSGGSYDLCFDGQGRLLVGDGNAVRRLIDKDNDGVFDSFEAIAGGLGWRGPQGLLVDGDRLFAVGGDGVQLFEGYNSDGPLVHKGRIGNKFNTGGDHEAHTIFRGHDGYIYLMSGDGGGITDRIHITEETSPVMFERSASVFRISPDGKQWECISAGGRNPPNLGMNYLGELFSFDSDMEWHVGLPWYRPVRLNHWAIGGDQGWQEVGAYPPYFIDCLPGILDVGRGSPDWGIFYEHTQLPEKYRDSYLVCDYRWKRESSDDYHTSGRLLAFFLKRSGAGWTATMETLARPKPGACDENGKPISFALIDIDVAPDGSLYLSDHNQGIWRLTYATAGSKVGQASSLPLERLLSLPQPGSAWSQRLENQLRAELGPDLDNDLALVALNPTLPLEKRLRAIRLLAPNFKSLPGGLLGAFANSSVTEIRGQAAWLMGIRDPDEAIPALLRLFNDPDPFVRRRVAEALTRSTSGEATEALVDHLADSSRLVRFISMIALAHRPASEWLEKVELRQHPQVRLRGVVASLFRREPLPDDTVRRLVVPLLTQKTLITEDRLDLLRVLSQFRKQVESKPEFKNQVVNYLVRRFPDDDLNIRWEQVRLLGEYRVSRAFPKLLQALETETNHVTQFHIAQSIAKLPEGWTKAEQQRLVSWFLGAQQGWFAEFSGKGVEFPQFWATVLADFGTHHREALLAELPKINLSGLLGGVAVNLIAETDTLLNLYSSQSDVDAKVKIIRALKKQQAPEVGAFLRSEYAKNPDSVMRGAILQSLVSQPIEPPNLPLLVEGFGHKDREVVRDCAGALLHYKPELNANLASAILKPMSERRELFHSLEKLLVALSGESRPEFDAKSAPRPSDAVWTAGVDFWKRWFGQRFAAEPALDTADTPEKSDEEIHRFLLSDAVQGGNATRGGRIYEVLQCHTCHGGGVTPGREGHIFGPDLAGITRRLSKQDFADSLVYPSKQVPDRFKAYEMELNDSTSLSGFVTEQNEQVVTLVDQQQVHRVPRDRIKTLRPQSISLMPDGLLNRASWDDIRDLMAFLEAGTVAPK